MITELTVFLLTPQHFQTDFSVYFKGHYIGVILQEGNEIHCVCRRDLLSLTAADPFC
jgi:hypothetical protein